MLVLLGITGMPGGTSKLVEEKVIMPCLNFESLSLKKYGGYTYVQNIRPVGEAFFLPMIATENRAPNFSLINRILNTVKEAYSTKTLRRFVTSFSFSWVSGHYIFISHFPPLILRLKPFSIYQNVTT